MRQLTFVEAGKLEWRETDDPRLEDERDALVRPVAVATCDLDSGLVQGTVPSPGPFPFGHEGVAEVVEAAAARHRMTPT